MPLTNVPIEELAEPEVEEIVLPIKRKPGRPFGTKMTPEGKKRAILNLSKSKGEVSDEYVKDYDHFRHVKSVLSDNNDFRYYMDRWNAYTREYTDFDSASDLDDLHLMIMELVIQRKLMADRKISTTKDNLKEWDASVSRHSKFKANLATSRDKRLSSGRSASDNNLATLILEFDKNKREVIKRREQEFLKEEEIEEAAKKVRDMNLLEASGLDKIIASGETNSNG